MQKLLFDATVLANYKGKNGVRSGIFFTAYNILKKLENHSDFEIYLYGLPENLLEIEDVQKDLFPNIHLFYSPSLIQIKMLKVYKKIDSTWRRFLKQPFLRKPVAFIRLLYIYILRLLFSPKPDVFNQFQIFLSPCGSIPAPVKRNKRISKYLILYDVVPLILPFYIHANQTKELVDSLSVEEFYFCISEYTRNDFQKFTKNVTKTNSEVVYLAAAEYYHQIFNKKLCCNIFNKYHIPNDKKYIFSLCTLEPRKNLIRIIKTFLIFLEKNKIENYCFVLGGGQWIWQPFWDKLKKEIPNFDDYKHCLIYTGYIDDEDLPVIYSNAEWFVYTSQYEGFGLPPLEAMQCGCPVITSNNSSLPEVVGDAGIMIDWDSDEQHIQAYEKYYFDENLREINRQKGLERAKLFSWEKTVDKMIEVMERK